MNLERMRALFLDHTDDLASDLEDAEVEEYLNRTYRYTIPVLVGGEFTEIIWALTLTVGQDEYDYDAHIVAPSGSAPWIKSYVENSVTVETSKRFLDIETNATVFEYSDRFNAGSTGYPLSLLFYERKVTVTPTPDRAYIVNIPARGGPSANLGSAGITNDTHAMAVVTGAASEFLWRSEDMESYAIQSRAFDGYTDLLRVYAQARPNERRPRRSF